MALPRRSFLKAFGALPLAPAVAKDALASAGIDAVGPFAASLNVAATPFGKSVSGKSYEEMQASGTRWLLANGVPDWMRDQIRSEMGPVSRLDPDLAAARSFSLSAKMRIQRERDVARQCSHILERRLLSAAREKWQKATGLDLW